MNKQQAEALPVIMSALQLTCHDVGSPQVDCQSAASCCIHTLILVIAVSTVERDLQQGWLGLLGQQRGGIACHCHACLLWGVHTYREGHTALLPAPAKRVQQLHASAGSVSGWRRVTAA